MKRTGDRFLPYIYCDQCGEPVPDFGMVLWPVIRGAAEQTPEVQPTLVTCSHDCADAIAELRADEIDGEWAAVPLDVYLANVVSSLQIDVERILNAEQAGVAADRTRDESPD